MKDLQTPLDSYYKANGWSYWTPHEILARLMEETGELARLINHRFGPKKKKNDEDEQNIEEEIGDILYTLACLANTQGFDLETALRKSGDTRSRKIFELKQ